MHAQPPATGFPTMSAGAGFESNLRDTNTCFFPFSLYMRFICIDFNLGKSPVPFYTAPGVVEPARLVRQRAEELLADTAWGREC